MPIKPEDLYTNKDKQQEYPRIYDDDELLAVVISFPLKEEKNVEVAVEQEEPTEQKETTINASEILAEGSVNLKLLKKKDKDEEDEEIKKLRQKLKESEEGNNIKEVGPINPITQAFLKVTTIKKLAEENN